MIHPGLPQRTIKDISLRPIDDYQFIDIHYHANPDLYDRRWSALEAGDLYQSFNGALVLRSHLGSTSAQATLAQRLDFPVLPSVTLNHFAGGIHYRVIMQALSQYQSLNPAKMIKEDLSAVLTSLPRVLYSSDLGQTSQMDVGDWLIFSNNLFTELKLTEQRKEDLWRNNAIALLS